MNSFAITSLATPLFNTPELAVCFGGADGNSLPLDDQRLMRTLETILFPGSKVKLLKQTAFPFIWKIETEDYSYAKDLFLDIRFLSREKQLPIKRILPPASFILKTLHQLENTRYIWGGNWPKGIDLLSTLYPSKTHFDELDPLLKDTWLLKGVDCSGLIHYATNGWTPRNTSSLVHFGKPVAIEGKDAQSIQELLQELDLIVWDGHVVCVLDKMTTIESKTPEGVIKIDSKKRLSEIMKERRPVNDWDASDKSTFVIRRWNSINLGKSRSAE